MKIKKEFIGSTIYKGVRKIYLGELISVELMEELIRDFPKYLEEEKPKKSKTSSPKIV
ncbi:MAG: hypothetical protein Unbinned3205contig1001_7 [Prokaryotic dsDNA virus sp.]|nr:MAG: hypothetical protein Unbinned3205contig1001_7 [Prokaryotic dsDNA virus sp.]|tara:strand:+ start:431 stop:604 length:174 start_codon:yes stop_codon:yes gene_type:complete